MTARSIIRAAFHRRPCPWHYQVSDAIFEQHGARCSPATVAFVLRRSDRPRPWFPAGEFGVAAAAQYLADCFAGGPYLPPAELRGLRIRLIRAPR